MPGPRPPSVDLAGEGRRELEGLVRRQKTGQQLADRARIVLLAAEGLNNSEIARQLAPEPDTVRLRRRRWLSGGGVARADLGAACAGWPSWWPGSWSGYTPGYRPTAPVPRGASGYGPACEVWLKRPRTGQHVSVSLRVQRWGYLCQARDGQQHRHRIKMMGSGTGASELLPRSPRTSRQCIQEVRRTPPARPSTLQT